MNGKAYPDGEGKNKKEAKQNAAKNALNGLIEELDDSVRLHLYAVYSKVQTGTEPVFDMSLHLCLLLLC